MIHKYHKLNIKSKYFSFKDHRDDNGNDNSWNEYTNVSNKVPKSVLCLSLKP